MNENHKKIVWKLHLTVSREKVFEFLSTDKGRSKFWAEETIEKDGVIEFRFPNGQSWKSKIIEEKYPEKFVLSYFNNGKTTFSLTEDGKGGTDLTLIDENFPAEEYHDIFAGWVSVLMSLKSAVEFGIDLRNHDAERTWNELYVEN